MPFSICRTSVLVFLGLLLGCMKTPTGIERDYAQTLRPKDFAPPPAESAATPDAPVVAARPLRVRVYVDEDFRNEVLHWKEKTEALFAAANQVIAPQLGVRLVAADFVDWNRRSTTGSLEDALAELQKRDSGEDVDLVLGLVGSLKVVSASQEELGYAYAFGAQAVMRNMDSPAESEALQAAFRHLPDDEREALYQERKRHKEISVLLHEWAHTLGAFHVSDSAFMMAPLYEPRQAQFAPETLKLLRLALEYSPASRKSRKVQQEFGVKLAALLAEPHGQESDGPDREAAVHWAELASQGEAPLQVTERLTPVDEQTLKEADRAYQEGRFLIAASQLTGLVERYPESARVQSLACLVDAGVRPDAAKETCATTTRRFPDQPFAPLALARLQLNAKDVEGAVTSIAACRSRLVGRFSGERGLWANVATLSRAAGQISWTEEAAAKMDAGTAADALRSWAQQSRRRLALPSGSAVPAEREWRFGQRARDAETLVERGPLAKARAALAGLDKEFPGTPLHTVLGCAVDFRAGQLSKAAAACDAALQQAPEAVNAHYLAALIALRREKRADAQAHLKEVIALDPGQRDAWVTLGSLYRIEGGGPELDALRVGFRKQFSAELP